MAICSICRKIQIRLSWGIQSKTLPKACATIQFESKAEVAQLVEQLIRNQQVIGSSPIFGSSNPEMLLFKRKQRNAH